MTRPHPLTVLLLSLVLAGLTVLFPPLFREDSADVQRGFPFPFVFQQALPGSNLPVVGWFINLLGVSTASFSVKWFLVDACVFMALLFFVFNLLGGRDE